MDACISIRLHCKNTETKKYFIYFHIKSPLLCILFYFIPEEYEEHFFCNQRHPEFFYSISETIRFIGVCKDTDDSTRAFWKKTYESQIWSLCITKRRNVVMSWRRVIVTLWRQTAVVSMTTRLIIHVNSHCCCPYCRIPKKSVRDRIGKYSQINISSNRINHHLL